MDHKQDMVSSTNIGVACECWAALTSFAAAASPPASREKDAASGLLSLH
jgi:hypothetical protein